MGVSYTRIAGTWQVQQANQSRTVLTCSLVCRFRRVTDIKLHLSDKKQIIKIGHFCRRPCRTHLWVVSSQTTLPLRFGWRIWDEVHCCIPIECVKPHALSVHCDSYVGASKLEFAWEPSNDPFGQGANLCLVVHQWWYLAHSASPLHTKIHVACINAFITGHMRIVFFERWITIWTVDTAALTLANTWASQALRKIPTAALFETIFKSVTCWIMSCAIRICVPKSQLEIDIQLYVIQTLCGDREPA